MLTLSHYQVAPLLKAREAGLDRALTSLDLNQTQTEVALDADGVVFGEDRVAWPVLAEIAEEEAAVFGVENGSAGKIQYFSAAFNRFYSLYPTASAPTMLLSGVPMHRIKNIDPHEDTRRKLLTTAPVAGRVLDVCTGLGYTAIEAAKTAGQVVTIELDPIVLDVARRNPWSRELFSNARILQRTGRAEEVVPTLEAESFARIFHDPPMFRIAGELYSEAFYRQLFRVLKKSGRLFHYIGDLDSTSGRTVAKGVVKRLQDVGFQRITRRPEAFGLTASK